LSEKRCELEEEGPCSCFIEKGGTTTIRVCELETYCSVDMCSATSAKSILLAVVIMLCITLGLICFIALCWFKKKVKKCVNCLLCSFLISKKSLEEQLEGSKLYSMYLKLVEDPYEPSTNPKYNNAQLALQKDLFKEKLEWTGDFFQDYKYYIWVKHPLVSMFRNNPVDLFEVNNRVNVFYMSVSVSCLFAFLASQEQESCDQLKETVCPKKMLWQYGGIFVLVIFEKIITIMATCSCFRNFSARIFSCTKKIGKVGLLYMSLFCVCVLIYTMFLAGKANAFKNFFTAFASQNVISWGLAFYLNIGVFWNARRESRKEREELLEESKNEKGKKKGWNIFHSNKTVPQVVADKESKALGGGIYHVDITETMEKLEFNFPERGVLFALTILIPIFVCMKDTNDYKFELKSKVEEKAKKEGHQSKVEEKATKEGHQSKVEEKAKMEGHIEREM